MEGSLLVFGWSKSQGGVCGLARVAAISENPNIGNVKST